MAGRLLVDVHTHVYLPRYATFLQQRVNTPYIFTRPSLNGKPSEPDEHRMRILDDEPAEGRPVGPQVSAFPHCSAGFASDSSATVLGSPREIELHGQFRPILRPSASFLICPPLG